MNVTGSGGVVVVGGGGSGGCVVITFCTLPDSDGSCLGVSAN